MTHGFDEVLAGIGRIPGVRSALLADREEGLVVAERTLGGVDPGPIAALTGGLAATVDRLCELARVTPPVLLHLEAAEGHLLAGPVGGDLLLAVSAEPDANLGLLRLALRDARERLA